MLALLSAWISLLTLMLAVVMLVYRPAFNDVTVPLVVMFGAPGALCLAILVLWAHRKDRSNDIPLAAQRMQCKVAIVLSLAAAAIVYGLVIFADRVPKN